VKVQTGLIQENQMAQQFSIKFASKKNISLAALKREKITKINISFIFQKKNDTLNMTAKGCY
jgi:ABC-type dipeptide/oligopeptide/nickel transport system ATPase component